MKSLSLYRQQVWDITSCKTYNLVLINIQDICIIQCQKNCTSWLPFKYFLTQIVQMQYSNANENAKTQMQCCSLPGQDLVPFSHCPLIYLSIRPLEILIHCCSSVSALDFKENWKQNWVYCDLAQNHQLSSNSDVRNICHFYSSQPPFWNI